MDLISGGFRSGKEQDSADVVLAELQYQESYDTEPLYDQRSDFNALVRAGADIVTAGLAVYKGMIQHPWTDEGLKRFCSFWDKTQYE